jgi:hypothetical protein
MSETEGTGRGEGRHQDGYDSQDEPWVLIVTDVSQQINLKGP